MRDSKTRIGFAALTFMLCLVLVGGANGAKKFTDRLGTVRTAPVKIEDRQSLEADAEQQSLPEMSLGVIEEDRMINWQIISSGGMMNGRSASYLHSGTIYQSAIGFGTTGVLTLKHGFWQAPPMSGSCCNNPGDANSDGEVNVGDAVFIISYVFKRGAAPDCYIEADCNGDCEVNVADAVYMVRFCFMDGHTPLCGCRN